MPDNGPPHALEAIRKPAMHRESTRDMHTHGGTAIASVLAGVIGRHGAAVLAVIGLLLLGACASFSSPSEQKRQKAFFEASETYRKLLRWGYYEEASQYLKGNGEEMPRPNLEALAHYKISGYHASEQLHNDSGDEVRLIAIIDFYDIDSGVVNSLRDEQYWWYDEPAKRWYLGSPMPELQIRRVRE
jgi:hypothetical protein